VTGHTIARLALLADALLAATVLCAPRRPRRAAVVAALVLTPVLLAGELWHSTQVTHLRHHPALAAAGVLAAVAVVGALVLVVRSRPQLLALLAVLALTFRFSFLAGGTGGILIPLYVVIAAGAVAFLLEGGDRDPAPGTAERALGTFVVLYAIQALYTPGASLSKAVEDVGFFLVPFSLLYVLLRRVTWDRALLARCARAVIALALLFVAVAAVEYASRRLLFNTALNANARFFRVNSLFYDPNIFGRFLALTIVLVAAAMLWEERPRRVLAAVALLVVLWFGLAGTVSQSSIVALLAGLAVLGAARFSLRWTAAAGAVVLAAGVAVALLASGSLHLSSANNATSDRANLVSTGIDLFADRPLAGYGAGSFSCEFLLHTGQSCAHPPAGVTSDSHTIPVTVAAEQGVIGLLAYLLLLAACAWRLAGAQVRRNVGRLAILAAFTAMVVHTWAYADFLEDPVTWSLLAVGSALAAG